MSLFDTAILQAIAILIGMSFVSFLVSPFIAWRKGYSPWYWLFACGPVGLIVIACLPSVKSAKTPEEYERLEARANFIGAVLSGIVIFLTTVPALLLVFLIFAAY
jgi:hypothetical protein